MMILPFRKKKRANAGPWAKKCKIRFFLGRREKGFCGLLLLAVLMPGPGAHWAAAAGLRTPASLSQRPRARVFLLHGRSGPAQKICARLEAGGFAARPAAPLDLEPGVELREIWRCQDRNGLTYARYQQYYQGLPLWGRQVAVFAGHGTLQARGELAEGLQAAVGDPGPAFDAAAALQIAKAHARSQGWTAGPGETLYGRPQIQRVVYIDDPGRAGPAYQVSFFSDVPGGGRPSRPYVIIDAKTREILKSWQGLANALVGTGPGGNTNTGQYEYGTDPNYGFLDVAQAGGTCTMETADVKTVNLNHGTAIDHQPAYSFTGTRNTYQAVNHAYCPLNDAHYFGTLACNLFWDWYGLKAIPGQLTIYVHYGTDYDGAFYGNEDYIAIGDGYTLYYPLVCADFIAHEVGHMFITHHDGPLMENRQWGAINEAFADMAGEAAEYYHKGTNDFQAWSQICQSNWDNQKALRYLNDPTRVPGAIDNFNDYHDDMNPHYTAGIFGKAFYVLATTSGWDTRKAFEVFAKASLTWTPNITFYPAADAVRTAAGNIPYSTADVENAFQAVGIDLTRPYIQITAPAAADTTATSYTLQWWDYYHEAALISLYYNTRRSGLDGTLIAANINAANGNETYDWDVTAVPNNTYFIYAVMRDQAGNSCVAYSPGSVTVLHADTYEPDDTCQQAAAMTLNSVQEHHSIVPAGDADWVRFDIQVVPNPLMIETSGESGDTIIWLIDSSGTQVLDSDDDGGSKPYFSKITYPITQPGTYYVRVEDSGGDPLGDYSISLQGTEPTPVLTSTQTPVLSPTPTPTRTPIPPTATVTLTATPTPRPALPEGGWAAPNPFVPGPGKKVTFNFRLQDPPAPCTIRILNLRGALVRTLDNTNVWDGRNQKGGWCEAGVYIYQIESNGRRVSGQLVMIK